MTAVPYPHVSATTAAPNATALPEPVMTALGHAALFQARRNLGCTVPNPSVGTVIASPETGEIIATAVTARDGRPHAEVLALRQAGLRAKGAILFTTLEPCSHFGATPPCANAIAEAGISTVIYGSADPDPRVSGQGFATLQAHGISVARGQRRFATESDWINLGHTLRVTASRPFVQLKIAIDSAGRVPIGNGKPVWATGEEARAQAHLLRAQADAILVGRTTIDKDDPALTCRLPGLEDRSPIRVVLSSTLRLSLDRQIFKDGGPSVWIICDDNALERTHFEQHGVRVLSAGEPQSGRLNLRRVLSKLAEEGITRLLVEGGPSTARSFIDAGFADEIIIMRGNALISAGGTLLPFGEQGIEWLASSPHFAKIEERIAGENVTSVFRSVAHLRG